MLPFLAACSPSPAPSTGQTWQYADVRALDPLDAAQPSHDLIALYLRTRGQEQQIRLDFFDLALFPDYDLTVLIDSEPGGATTLPIDANPFLQWEYLLQVPAAGAPQFLDQDFQPIPGLTPRVIRDPNLDTLTIHFFPGKIDLDPVAVSVAVFLTAPDSKTVADKLGPVHPLDPRPGRVPVLLAFWNTFPAYSPAQALRRWAGAHTGPFGERHGLSQLVAGADRFSVPVMLLDLKNAPSLSALDSLNVLPEIQARSDDQFLQLPDGIYLPVTAGAGDLAFLPPPAVLVQSAASSRKVGKEFGLAASQALFAPILPGSLDSGHHLILQPPHSGEAFNKAPFETQVTRWGDRLLVHLPELLTAQDLQTTAEGLTPTVRRVLLEWALEPRPPESAGIMVLGGDFIKSPWGDPQAGAAGLHYLAAHPWIQMLTESDLLAFDPIHTSEPSPPPLPPAFVPYTIQGAPILSGQTVGQIQTTLIQGIEELPDGPLKDQAWAAYFALLAPNPPPHAGLPALRASYLGQIGGLLAAARWAENPAALSDCQGDPDLDGEAECILANENLFLLFEPAGARLVLAFINTPTGPHQWIAPLSQFLVGYGDPHEWDLARGPAGDPGDIPGAFADASDRWTQYSVTELVGGLELKTLLRESPKPSGCPAAMCWLNMQVFRRVGDRSRFRWSSPRKLASTPVGYVPTTWSLAQRRLPGPGMAAYPFRCPRRPPSISQPSINR